MSFNLPRDRIARVDRIDVRLDPAQHPFERAQAAAIQANWDRETEANPALFDGRMMLLSALSLDDGVLSGTCHEVRYATLLHWRKARAPGAEHAFAHAALVSSDGALVAIRMGAHTANPGRVYFAAGSFEAEDFVDGQVDVEANMVREVGEETGIDLSSLDREPGYHLFSQNGATVLFRCYRLGQTADAVADAIRAHVAAETNPEIEGPVIIRDPDRLPEGTMPHMAAIVRWYFETRPLA